MGGRGSKGGGGGNGNTSDIISQLVKNGVVLTPDQQKALNIMGGAGTVNGNKFLSSIAAASGGGAGGGSTSKKGTASASTGGITTSGGGGGGSSSGGGSSNTTINQQPVKGYKPSFDTSTVPIKPGTTYTPNIGQSSLASSLPSSAVSDPFAPLGSEDNPHVFKLSNKKDWQTFGAMHTNQDKEAWGSKEAYGHAYKYTAATAEYNRLSAPDAGSPLGTPGKDNQYTLGLDKAFDDQAVRPLEEHTILVSSQDAMFFAGANGIDIPDVFNSGQTKPFQASNGMDTDDILNDVGGLIGKEFIYTNFLSTAIPVDKEFGWGKKVRVLIKAKPGQKAVYVSGNPIGVPGNPGGGTNAISHFNSNEAEMILPRNQTIKIVDVLPTMATSSSSYEIDVIVEIGD